MGFAVRVEDTGGGIVAHAAGAVLVPDPINRDALLEVSMERDRGGRVSSPLENVNSTVFKAIEGLDFIWCVGEPNPLRRGICHGLGLVGAAGVSGGMGANDARLPTFDGEQCGALESDAIFRVWQILCREPPRNSVVIHSFQDKAWSKWRSVAVHHLEVEAADRLHLP